MELDQARCLLVNSYRVSAKRVIAALDGGVTVQNSREPALPPPPDPDGDVLGLCGQSGRHRYFRIPVLALRTAAEDILRLTPREPDSEATMQAITAVSQQLRRQTIFDDHSGCVNDQLPAIVPLLPPEEIWYDGRELPLDVWRLLSFDLDLVSSALASQVPLEDIAFGSLTPSGLAFRALMAGMQAMQIELAVTGQNLPSAFSTGLNASPRHLRVPLARVFFEAGSLLTPVRQSASSQWYAAMRYRDWIANTPPRFCVLDDLRRESVDSRYRGLFAEEIAVGMMAIVLEHYFGASPILNTAEYVALNSGHVTLSAGPIADFIATTRLPKSGVEWTIIAESKGSLGKPVSKARVKHAKTQTSATRARFVSSQAKLPLAFSSSVYFESQAKSAACTVIDPPAEPSENDLLIDPAAAWQVAYAQVFRFVGLDSAAHQVLAGAPITTLQAMDERRRDDRELDSQRFRRARLARQTFGAALLLDVGPCAVGIDPTVLGLLRESPIRSDTALLLAQMADRRLHQERRPSLSFLNHLGIGCIFYEELEGR